MFTVALIRAVFPRAGDVGRMRELLRDAASRGAALAVLPELPLNAWVPATQQARDEDAELPEGPRHLLMSAAARACGIAVLGGVIEIDPTSGRRYNTALLLEADGSLRASYRKLHLPEEPGFWETSHYQVGDDPPAVIDGFPLRLGIQLCSDVNRPQGTHILAAQGAEVVLCPRATEAGTFGKWRLVLQANALTSCAYVLSVPRPAPEFGVPLGGPSIAIAPDGGVLAESEDETTLVSLDPAILAAARQAYPGYLPVRGDVYARGWRKA